MRPGIRLGARKVFISYRRDDTGPAAGRLYDRLSLLLPKSSIFFDVDTIAGGDDFKTMIERAIAQCDAVLVFIGERWLEPAPPAGQPRIWHDGDYVRAEVRAALGRPITLVPVLVGGARMPGADELPEDIRPIVTKNALPLRHASFDDDTENIVAAALGAPPRRRLWDRQGGIPAQFLRAVAGVVIAAVVLLFGALAHFWMLGRPLSASLGAPLTILMVMTVLILGLATGWRSGGRRWR